MLFLLLLGCSAEPTLLDGMVASRAWLEGADFSTGAVIGGVVAGDAILFVENDRGEIWGERVSLAGPVLALGLEVNADPEWGGAVSLDLPSGETQVPAEELFGTYRGPAAAFGVGVGVSGRRMRNRHGVSFEESHLAFGVGVMVALQWLRIAPGGSENLEDSVDFSWSFIDSGWGGSRDSAADDSLPDDSAADDSAGGDSAADDSGPTDSPPLDSGVGQSRGCDCSSSDDSGPSWGDSAGGDSAGGDSAGGDSAGGDSAGGDSAGGGDDTGGGAASSGCGGSGGIDDTGASSSASRTSGDAGCSGSTSGGSSSLDCGGSSACATAPTRGGMLAFVLVIAALRRRYR